MTFGQWMAAVNTCILDIAGVTAYDLADQCWSDWFEDGMEPAEAAEGALLEEGFPTEVIERAKPQPLKAMVEAARLKGEAWAQEGPAGGTEDGRTPPNHWAFGPL